MNDVGVSKTMGSKIEVIFTHYAEQHKDLADVLPALVPPFQGSMPYMYI